MRVYRSHDGVTWDITGPEWARCPFCDVAFMIMTRKLSTGRVQYSPSLDKQLRSHRANCIQTPKGTNP